MRKLALMAMVGSLCLSANVSADTVTLTNGQVLQGLVVEDTATQVRVRLAWQGYMTIGRGEVASIAHGAEVEHARLLTQWAQDFEAARARAEEQERFEIEQRARGLVLYRGQWVSLEVLTAIEHQAQLQETLAQQREMANELERQGAQLAQLLRENEELRRQLAARPKIVYLPQNEWGVPRFGDGHIDYPRRHRSRGVARASVNQHPAFPHEP